MLLEKKEFVFKVQKDSSLNTQVINKARKKATGQPSEWDEINEMVAMLRE